MNIRAIIFTIVLGGLAFFVLALRGSDQTAYPHPRDFAPNFWFDSEEKYYPTNPLDFYYDENLNELAGKEARKKYDSLSNDEKLKNFKVFYNIDDSGDDLVYQYWLFYIFNDSKNEHYGDWESVFVFTSRNGEIRKVVASAHNGTESKIILSNDEFLNPNNNSRIIIEKGSHANCIDSDEDGLFNRFSDSGSRSSYCFLAFFAWSSVDKLHGLKIEHDSPYYNLRPISEIKDVFGKKYGADRSLITKEKSPSLGMLPFKIGKDKKYALPFGGDPPSNAWNKKQFVDSSEVLPMTGSRLAANITGFFSNAGNFLAAVGKTVATPFVNFFGGDDDSTSIVSETKSDSLSVSTVDVGALTPVGGQSTSEAAPVIERGLTPPLRGQTPAVASEAEAEFELAFVTRVIDGDTVELASGQRLRYLGINSPELPDECFAKEATEKNRELAEGRQLSLLKGPRDTDDYGRLLRFAWQDTDLSGTLSSGDLFVNRELVEGGYAYAFDYGEIHDYEHALGAAEAKAKRESLGLWGDACSGKKNFEELPYIPKPIVRIYEPPTTAATPPDMPIVSIPNNTYFNLYSDINNETSGYQINLFGTAEPHSIITIVQNPVYTATTSKDGNWMAAVTLLNEGANNFSITAKDSLENTSISGVVTLNLDSIAPTSTIAVAGYKIDEPEFEIKWNSDVNDLNYYEVEYKIGGSGAWQDWGSATTTAKDKDYKNATTNTYYFRARGTDVRGNIGEWKESQAITIDLSSPIVINEIQLADSEFVELYNPSSKQIDLGGYYFSYYSSNRTSWLDPWLNKLFPEGAKISAAGYFLIGLNGYPISGGNPNSDWQPYDFMQLSNSQGTVAIFPFNPTSASSSQYAYDNRADAAAWGPGVLLYEGASATTTPTAGESLTRNGNHADTENNSVDFTVATSTTPINSKGETYNPSPPPPPNTSPVWAMFQKDARHSGLATLSGPTWTNSSQATTTWIFNIGSGRSQPVLDASSTLYVTNALGEVYAINSSGTQKWKFDPRGVSGVGDGWADASPALSSDGSRVYSVYTDNEKKKLRLFSIRTSDGKITPAPDGWKYAPIENGYNQTITSPILDENGNIYFAGNYTLYSISPSGSLNWSKTLSPSGLGLRMPAIAKENGIEYVYISGIVSNNAGDRYIWKIRASDGSESCESCWKQNPDMGNTLVNGISINAAGTIYTGGYLNIGTSGLFAIAPSNGSKIWSNNVGDSLASNLPSFDADGNIYLGTVDTGDIGAFHKITNATSTPWSFVPDASPSAVQYPAVIDGQGRIYVGAKNKFIYALNPASGAVIWKYELSDYAVGFAIGNGRLYVVGYDGKVYAFGQ